MYLILLVSLLQGLILKDPGSVWDPDPLEQVLCLRRGSQGCHQGCPRPASEQGNLWGVASEMVDVEFDPLQGRDDVTQAVVAGGWGVGPLGEGVEGEEAKDVAAVVNTDEDDTLVLGQSCEKEFEIVRKESVSTWACIDN